MKNLLLCLLAMASASSAEARVGTVVNCADDYTSVRISTTGFGTNQYDVLIKDLRNGEELPYTAIRSGDSFKAREAGQPTINVAPNSIAFVKAGWGLVIIENENCEINID